MTAAVDPVVIAGAARTPMGGFQGELSGRQPLRLVVQPLKRRWSGQGLR